MPPSTTSLLQITESIAPKMPSKGGKLQNRKSNCEGSSNKTDVITDPQQDEITDSSHQFKRLGDVDPIERTEMEDRNFPRGKLKKMADEKQYQKESERAELARTLKEENEKLYQKESERAESTAVDINLNSSLSDPEKNYLQMTDSSHQSKRLGDVDAIERTEMENRIFPIPSGNIVIIRGDGILYQIESKRAESTAVDINLNSSLSDPEKIYLQKGITDVLSVVKKDTKQMTDSNHELKRLGDIYPTERTGMERRKFPRRKLINLFPPIKKESERAECTAENPSLDCSESDSENFNLPVIIPKDLTEWNEIDRRESDRETLKTMLAQKLLQKESKRAESTARDTSLDSSLSDSDNIYLPADEKLYQQESERDECTSSNTSIENIDGLNIMKKLSLGYKTMTEIPEMQDKELLPENTFHELDLLIYLKNIYEKSTHLNKYLHHGLEKNRSFSFGFVPKLEIIDSEGKKIAASGIEEAISMYINETSSECPHVHRYCKLCGSFKSFQSVLLLTKETNLPGNYFVFTWLQSKRNETEEFSSLLTVYPSLLSPRYDPYKLPDNQKFMSKFAGVFLVDVAEEDDVSDLKELMSKTFEMKDAYFVQKILIVFECNHENPGKIRALYDTAKSWELESPLCTFLIITSVDESRLAKTELNAERTVIADGVESVNIGVLDSECVILHDFEAMSKHISQIVSKRNGQLWEKDIIEKIRFENITFTDTIIRIPEEIRSISIFHCHGIPTLLHSAEKLEVTPIPERNLLQVPLQINMFSSRLTTVSLSFSEKWHIFHRRIYCQLATGLYHADKINSLVLSNMKVGKKVLSIELEKQEVKDMAMSARTNEDYRRYGARILGPRLGKQTFDKEDIEAETHVESFAAYVMLDLISYELVKMHNSVSECYAAKRNNDKTVLVCYVKTHLDIDSFKGFSLEKRDINCVSRESLRAENLCDRKEPAFVKTLEKEFVAINETVSYHADTLMENHRNLEAVKVSFIKCSKGQYIYPHPCIVLYCRTKGYIPFGEDPFPKCLNHPFKDTTYDIDVREGYFTSCPYLTNDSTQWSKELALGCSIGEINGNTAATLGPLVNVKETGDTCFLTVRHLFAPLPPARNDDQITGAKVVQPADCQLPPRASITTDRVCGEVLASQIGGQIDAAVVKISSERIPTRGYFVNIAKEDLNFAGLSVRDLPTYDDGAYMDAKTLTVKNNATKRIIKIGNKTSLTKGTLCTTDGVVRETMEYTTLETLYNGSREKWVVRSQLLVDSYVKKIFCQAGDSGSAVFLVDDDNRLYCIGMVIGMLADDCTAVVTPIQNILDILGHKLGKTLELKKFEFDQMDEL